MTKPIGPICNIGCEYCFYLEKERLYAPDEKWKMPDAVLERYIQDYIEAQPGAEVNFAWQGGEPTLLGVDFFRRVVALQQRYANGRTIANAIQTNGTLLDDEWGGFLAAHGFLVGISLDGPRELHDRYRVDKHGRPTYEAVMRGLSLLKKHGVEYNTLTVVHRDNSRRPLDVYRFLREVGSGYIQFIPLVERPAATGTVAGGLALQGPTSPQGGHGEAEVTPWSVAAADYGAFLVAIFDEWVRRDVGRVFVQLFDVALNRWAGLSAGLCVFDAECGRALAVEHNGDVYACDHYVYSQYRLGNLMNRLLGELAASPQQQQFGRDKSATLPKVCRQCPVGFACQGECPKHRFTAAPDGEPGLNYLCAAYKRFFTHVDPHMQMMVALLHQRRAPAEIMSMRRRHLPEEP